jgi:hypothetical protein
MIKLVFKKTAQIHTAPELKARYQRKIEHAISWHAIM